MTERRKLFEELSLISLLLFAFLAARGLLSHISPYIYKFFSGGREEASIYYSVYSIVFFAVVYIIPSFIYLSLRKKRKNGAFCAKARLPRKWGWILISSITAISIAGYASNLLFLLLEKAGIYQNISYLPVLPKSAAGIILYFFSIVLFPALTEEFVCRGIILKSLTPYGRYKAVFLSAVVFALLHISARQVVYAFAAGIILGAVTISTGSVFMAFLIHFLNNFISFAYLFALEYITDLGAITVISASAVAFGATGLIAGIVLALSFLKRKKLAVLPVYEKGEWPSCFGFFLFIIISLYFLAGKFFVGY